MSSFLRANSTMTPRLSVPAPSVPVFPPSSFPPSSSFSPALKDTFQLTLDTHTLGWVSPNIGEQRAGAARQGEEGQVRAQIQTFALVGRLLVTHAPGGLARNTIWIVECGHTKNTKQKCMYEFVGSGL
jgi:hypothetical protein